MILQGSSRLEVLHVGGNWDNSGNAGPFATNGNNSALNANSNCASFGVSFLPRLISRWTTRLYILSYLSKINTQRKKAPVSK